MRKGVLLTSLMTAAVVTGGCTQWADRSQQIGVYRIGVDTVPRPPEVGKQAQVTVHLERQSQPADGCKVRFRRYADGASKEVRDWQQAKATNRRGVYQGLSAPFGGAGKWHLQVGFNCDSREHTATFSYQLSEH